jgi:hypothetical protein
MISERKMWINETILDSPFRLLYLIKLYTLDGN